MRHRARSGQDGCVEPMVVVAYDGVQPIDVVGPYEAFAFANDALTRRGEAPAYDLSIVCLLYTSRCV